MPAHRARRKAPKADLPAPQRRGTNARQRLRLINACISALHLHGPSRTTVARVVAIAGMSPGIVRFYFASKAAMLVASLEFLAAEFELRVLVPVAQLRADPVRALQTLVELYLDPDIASPRKVSVWYSFWGEASSRQEYYDICGQKDARFAQLVHELVGALIEHDHVAHLDADGVALGLIGALEMLWQDFAFQSEAHIDRGAAKRRCLAYLRSVFPQHFARDAAQATRGMWQLAEHECVLSASGDFATVDLGGEQALIVRAASGGVEAFRNQCPYRPHRLVAAARGHLGGPLECPIHGPLGRSVLALSALPVLVQDGFIWLRIGAEAQAGSRPPALRPMSAGRVTAAAPVERTVAVDWRALVEHWLEFEIPEQPLGRLSGLLGAPRLSLAAPGGVISWQASLEPQGRSWFARRYASLAGGGQWHRIFLPPNQFVELREDGISVLQVLPEANGHCRVRWLEFHVSAAERRLRAMAFLARRLRATRLAQDIEAVGAAQAAGGAPPCPAVAAFRAWREHA